MFAGVPGITLVVLSLFGRAPRRRRVTSILATSVCGFLALAGAPGLGALGTRSTGALYQAGCFAISVVFLAIAWPAWRRANDVGSRAQAQRDLYDEL